jgi:hypothetical protein
MPTVNLTYRENVPSWEISPPEPNSFKGVPKAVIFRMFYFPEGALLAYFAKLYDMPEQPYLFHRILDINDNANKEYLESMIKSGQMILVFKDQAQEYFTEYVPVAADEIRRMISEGEAYNKRLTLVSGGRALDKFAEAFNEYFPKLGAEGSWNAVEKYYQRPVSVQQQPQAQPQFQTAGLNPEAPAGNYKPIIYWFIAFAVAAAGAWLIAERGLWWWIVIGGGIIIFLIGWMNIREFGLRNAVLATLLWVIWLFIGIKFTIAPVYIDNYSGYNIKLKLNGSDWVDVLNNNTVEKSLRKGAYDIIIIDSSNNKEIKRSAINVSSGDPHILNVLGKMSYYKGTAVYSTTSYYGSGGSSGETITSEWFSADVDYLFEELPSSIQISRGSTAYKSYLKRQSIYREPEEYREEEKKPEYEEPEDDESPEERTR